MLEGIDRVDWGALHHAYGPAVDVPDQIRALASPDAGARQEARHELYGNVFHQGTRWQASCHAVPFLADLAEAPAVEERDGVVHLLVSIAIGYAEEHLPFGPDPARAFAGLEAMSEAEEAEGNRRLFEKDAWDDLSLANRMCRVWARRAYEAVEREVPRFVRLARDRDDAVREAAVYALAWFPRRAAESRGVARERAEEERDPRARANAILARGLLRDVDGVRIAGTRLERIAAAIALATARRDPASGGTLVDAIADAEAVQAEADGLAWNDGDLVGYCGATLKATGVGRPESAVPALCRALEAVAPMASLNVTAALLSFAFPDRRAPASLSALQRQACEAIARHGAWTIGHAGFANYGETVRAFGLPDRHDDFRAWLRGA